MDCRFDSGLLQDYLDGTIEPLEKIFVEEHLKVCRKCRRELSEMKLLFWDVEEAGKEEVEIPPELEQVREAVLTELFPETERKFTMGSFLGIQKGALSGASVFLKYLPGAEAGGRAVEKTVKAAPSALLKASGYVLKRGLKVARMRFQT